MMTPRHALRLTLVCGLALLSSGCILDILLGQAFYHPEGDGPPRTVASIQGTATTAACDTSTSPGATLGATVMCHYSVGGNPIDSLAEFFTADGLFEAIIDPVILQVPATATSFSGTLLGPGGYTGTLGITVVAGSLAADGSTFVTPEPGSKLVIVDFPTPPPPLGALSYTLNFQVPGDATPLQIKMLFAARVTTGGRTFYAPMLPCESTFASVPAITLPTGAALQSVTLPPLASAAPCSGKVYDFRAGATLARGIVTGPGPGGAPHVKVFDGLTGAEVRSFFAYECGTAPPPCFPGGVAVAAGDLDGDGAAEIVTGPGPGRLPEIRAFDTAGTQRLGYQVYPGGFQGGIRVAACDFDNDGRAEIVSAVGPGGASHVRVMRFDATGQFIDDLASFFPYDLGFVGGLFVACGDLDGDHVPEIILGVDAGGGPHIRILRLLGGALSVFDEFFAYDPAFRGGIRVAAGDVTGDGVAELIVGAGPGGGPHVRVFGYATGFPVELAGVMVYDPGFRQGVYVAAGDVDGDGIAEVVTSADGGGGPHVRVLRYAPAVLGGLTGLSEFFAYEAEFRGGVRVGVIP
jgi:hypothetical protein